MTKQSNLAQIDFTGLVADKPNTAETFAASQARAVLEGKRPLPDKPDPAPLVELFNNAAGAIAAAEEAAAAMDRANLAADASRVQLEEALADRFVGRSESEALDCIRAARDADDLCGLGVRRAEATLAGTAADRRNAVLDLGAACRKAANAATVRVTAEVMSRVEAEIAPELRERLGSDLEDAIDTITLASKDAAIIGGAAAGLSGRLRDVTGPDATPAATRYFLRDCRRIIEFLSAAEEMPIDPILEPIHGDKPRRGFPKRRA
jgi:hypothetical protein